MDRSTRGTSTTLAGMTITWGILTVVGIAVMVFDLLNDNYYALIFLIPIGIFAVVAVRTYRRYRRTRNESP